MVNPGTGRDEKGTPINAPSIDIGALVGAGSLWPPFPTIVNTAVQNSTRSLCRVRPMFVGSGFSVGFGTRSGFRV